MVLYVPYSHHNVVYLAVCCVKGGKSKKKKKKKSELQYIRFLSLGLDMLKSWTMCKVKFPLQLGSPLLVYFAGTYKIMSCQSREAAKHRN